MKKLKLDLDQVQVTSFPAEAARNGDGTVNGFAAESAADCSWPFGCPDMPHSRQDACTLYC